MCLCIDFGLTKFKDKLDERKKAQAQGQEESVMGSIHWTAPELFDDPNAYSKASDVYR